MDASRLEIRPQVWLDHRRALFLEAESILAVADLHLGYTWAHRFHGQMLPIGCHDPLLERLRDLCAYYRPRTLAVLGDIVHAAVPVTQVREELTDLVEELQQRCAVRLIAGNHDRQLRTILPSVELSSSFSAGRFVLTHGNEICSASADAVLVMGHEHPAIGLGDGITGAKFPCFLVSDHLLILPAFSLWAAGTSFGAYRFMSHLARSARFTQAVAICAEKLLRINV